MMFTLFYFCYDASRNIRFGPSILWPTDSICETLADDAVDGIVATKLGYDTPYRPIGSVLPNEESTSNFYGFGK